MNQENEKPIHDKWSHAMRAFEYWCVNVSGLAVLGPDPIDIALYGSNYQNINKQPNNFAERYKDLWRQ